MPDPSILFVLDDNAARLVVAQTIILIAACWVFCWRFS
jgi:hypothetical protein